MDTFSKYNHNSSLIYFLGILETKSYSNCIFGLNWKGAQISLA